MATVEFRYDPKNTAWFTANAAMVLKAGEPAYHDTTGLFKLGDGVTALSALSFLPTVSASTPTIQQVLTAGQVATTTIETTGFIKTGGLSTQFLKADGTIDSNVYGVGNALTSNPLSQFAATTSSQLAGVISDETGTGALVFGTSPSFTTSIFSPLVNGASTASGTLTLASTSNATKGVIQIGTTDLVNIGNKTTTSQRLVRIGQDTAWIDIGSLGGGGSANGAIYFNQVTPGLPNSALWGNASATNLNVPTGGNINIKFNNSDLVTMYGTLTGVSLPNFLVTLPSMTTVTTTANSPSFRVSGANKQWATGTVANQYWNYLTANTAAFVGASTMTNSYGLFVEAATAGTNATITNNFSLGTNGAVKFDDGTSKMIWRAVPSVATWSGIFLNVTPSTTNYTVLGDGSGLTALNGTASSRLQVGASDVVRANFASIQNTPNDGGTSSTTLYSINPTTQTGGTGSTEISTFSIGSYTRTWGIGAITTQRWAWLKTPTVAFGSAYTVTNSYGLYVEAATAGANATITNNFALGLAGSLKINDTFNIVFDTTTGTKIGTGTTQKLSFWNATPIVQPTTAVAAATVVSGTGGNVKHDDTFDGYTVEKVVRALRNIGLLA